MLVFAGLPAARQRDRGGGEGWPREREMERREGQEAAIGRISTRRDEDEGCASLARATKEKDETGKISPCVERTRRGEKREIEEKGGYTDWWVERRGMEEEWRGWNAYGG